MSVGTAGGYWDGERLPSVFKHTLLNHYIPVFCNKTGNRSGSVVYLDGYAGEGQYLNGQPGSAEMILKHSLNSPNGIDYNVFLFEKEKGSYGRLESVVNRYREQGVKVDARNCDIAEGIGDVLSAAQGKPLFLFLDPCGLGLPFENLADALKRTGSWPPTEVLLNFSLAAVRRIGGTARSSKEIPEAIPARLDETLGGTWWRDIVKKAGNVEPPVVGDIVRGFRSRLDAATGLTTSYVAVRKAPHHKPLYLLVFATKHPIGVWHFANAAAKARQAWWTAHEASLPREDSSDAWIGLEALEAKAVPMIAENIAKFLAENGSFVLGDEPKHVFGEYLGQVREKTARAAVKLLHRQNRISTDGVGLKVEKILVTPPGPQ